MAERVEIDIIARTEKAVAGLGKLVKSLAATYISYRALKDFLVGSIKEALEAEQAFVALGASLRASGQSAEVYTKQLAGLARALSMTTTFAEEETMAAMQSLTQIGRVSAEGMKKVIPVVQDLAAGLGMDLNSAALLVGKAIEGNVGALSRYGIKIKETADPAERFSNIIKALTERFGGMSDAMAKSAGGGLKQIRNEFNELKEAVGTRLLQAFKDTIFGLSSMMKSSTIMKMSLGDIGSKEEAAAYVQVLDNEVKRLQKDIADVGKYAPLTALLYPKGKPSSVKYLDELKARINEINVMVSRMPKDKIISPLLAGAGDAGKGAKALEQATSDVADAYAEINGRIALATQYQEMINDQFETGANSVYKEVDALIELGNAYAKLIPTTKDFSNSPVFNFLGGSSPGQMEAFFAKVAEENEKIKDQWTDIGNQVADWAGALGAAAATGNFDNLFQKILSMTSTLAIQAAASAAVAQNWPMVAFWLGVAGLASFAGGYAGAAGGKTEVEGMASGGIVTSPRLALIGEKGPEAVIPLGRGMGGNTIIVQGSVWAARDLAREIAGVQSRW